MDMEGYLKKLHRLALSMNEGEKWAKIRKLANHSFHAESLKSMVPDMCSSVENLLESVGSETWESSHSCKDEHLHLESCSAPQPSNLGKRCSYFQPRVQRDLLEELLKLQTIMLPPSVHLAWAENLRWLKLHHQ